MFFRPIAGSIRCPEVPALLRQIRDWGLPRGILSNGEPGMLADAVQSAALDEILDFVLSVETVGVFKPAPSVYRLAEEEAGTDRQPDRLRIVQPLGCVWRACVRV